MIPVRIWTLNIDFISSFVSIEKLYDLLQTVGTVSQLFSTNWMNDSFGDLLSQIQMQVRLL